MMDKITKAYRKAYLLHVGLGLLVIGNLSINTYLHGARNGRNEGIETGLGIGRQEGLEEGKKQYAIRSVYRYPERSSEITNVTKGLDILVIDSFSGQSYFQRDNKGIYRPATKEFQKILAEEQKQVEMENMNELLNEY